ncbi:hypothetical protein [Ostreiculturibacter nitratireducens]|uniref:hypothetical protein n=1 Tax=Ostreiculturibacter nitratireducens TaxID=3075226 RepID=UPI0031B5BF48
MKRLFRLIAAVCVALAPLGLKAETVSEIVFQYKAWEVQIVGFDDGSIACVAQVREGGESFSIWSDEREMVRLQFYSDIWEFDGGSADLEIQIDRRAPWTLTNAELYMQSVLFDIPDTDVGLRFLTEVMRGNVLYLRNDRGDDVQSYSLAGSSASIRALIDCVDVLQGNPSNPFQ